MAQPDQDALLISRRPGPGPRRPCVHPGHGRDDETELDTMSYADRLKVGALRAALEIEHERLARAAARRRNVVTQAAERVRSLEDSARWHQRELDEAEALLSSLDSPDAVLDLLSDLPRLIELAPKAGIVLMQRDALRILQMTPSSSPNRPFLVRTILNQLRPTGVLEDIGRLALAEHADQQARQAHDDARPRHPREITDYPMPRPALQSGPILPTCSVRTGSRPWAGCNA